MLIYVLPISGGAFPNQLSLLYEVGLEPDLMLCASGGNVAGYIYSASNGDEQKGREIVSELNRDMFIQGTEIGGFLRGHFLKGEGVTELFQSIFTPETISRHEIITLTCQNNKIQPRIFSNRTKETSFFQEPLNIVDNLLFQCKEVEFLEGNIENISIISMASASIPGIAQPQVFKEDTYVDGGVCFASPFTPLSNYIRDKIIDEEINPIQCIYFSCYDMSKISEMEDMISKNMSKLFKLVTRGSTRSMLERSHFSGLQDRARTIETIVELGNLKYCKINENATREILRKKLESLKNENYVMILQPHGYPEINLLNFTGKDILDVMDLAKTFSYYIWCPICD